VQAERIDKIEYFHIELDSHDVILAEGALSESFIDDDSRGMFHNAHFTPPVGLALAPHAVQVWRALDGAALGLSTMQSGFRRSRNDSIVRRMAGAA
jgi:hypothetical protein